MFDSDLSEQLKSAFAGLEKTIGLVPDESQHPQQAELIEMLTDLAGTSAKIKVTSSKKTSAAPKFRIFVNEKPTGISFTGIPGGHEFTSLVLAILNADGKGKLPDPVLTQRICSIKGPIHIQTFMSLTCENCPDVVQALNQMALLHPDFQHEIIDGGFAQDEVSKIGIQGVPSVIVNSKLIHSGRIGFLDLLTKVENSFGKIETDGSHSIDRVEKNLGHFNVVVIGGGPAGASAAIYSVRKGLSTAILAERVGGQVQETRGIENLISIPYTEGPQLASKLQEHISAYPIQVFEQRRVSKVLAEIPKKIELESGEHITADSVIVTTGAKWRELNVPGEKEYMGRGVAYCPHCDGPFYKGKKVAVVGGGNSGVEAAIDLAGIVREVVLIEFLDTLKADQILINKLKSLSNISIITNTKTNQILGDGQKMLALEYQNRSTHETVKLDLDAVFIQIGLVPNSQFLKDSVEMTKFGEIKVDDKGRTSIKGIYAAGDVTTTPYKQIIIAMGEGAKAALASFEDRMFHTP